MRRILFPIALAVLASACATSPLGRKQFIMVSEDSIAAQGVASFQEMQKQIPLSKDPRQVAYVQCISDNITRQIPGLREPGQLSIPANWEVRTFASEDVNAFALPGGKIGVYTGLLQVAKGQDQLAAVIGHEVAHVIAGHSNERVSQQQVAGLGMNVAQLILGGGAGGGAMMSALGAGAQYGVLLPFSRAHESEADLLGLDYMAKAGFDPRAAAQLWRNMAQAGGQKPPEFASSHPSDETRIRQIEARVPQDLPVFQQAQAGGKKPKCG